MSEGCAPSGGAARCGLVVGRESNARVEELNLSLCLTVMEQIGADWSRLTISTSLVLSGHDHTEHRTELVAQPVYLPNRGR